MKLCFHVLLSEDVFHSALSAAVVKFADKNNRREEGRADCDPGSQGDSVHHGGRSLRPACHMTSAARKECKAIKPEGPPPATYFLQQGSDLEVLKQSQTEPPPGDHVFQTCESMGDMSYSNHVCQDMLILLRAMFLEGVSHSFSSVGQWFSTCGPWGHISDIPHLRYLYYNS